jgi:hypothetical protein
LNKALEGHTFILVGPGRWGSSNSLLGVPVSYADIYNASALVELAIPQAGAAPDPSYGTHFFQDLVEARIFPLAVYPEDPQDYLNRAFIERAGNTLAALSPEDADYGEGVKVIRVPDEPGGCHVELAMDGERALAFFCGDSPAWAERPPVEKRREEEPQNPFLGW